MDIRRFEKVNVDSRTTFNIVDDLWEKLRKKYKTRKLVYLPVKPHQNKYMQHTPVFLSSQLCYMLCFCVFKDLHNYS